MGANRSRDALRDIFTGLKRRTAIRRAIALEPREERPTRWSSPTRLHGQQTFRVRHGRHCRRSPEISARSPNSALKVHLPGETGRRTTRQAAGHPWSGPRSGPSGPGVSERHREARARDRNRRCDLVAQAKRSWQSSSASTSASISASVL